MTFDLAQLARHVGMIHRLAKGQPGKLILAVFGDGIAPAVYQFPTGDSVATIEAVANVASQFENVAGANLYMPLAVMRSDLAEGSKGGEADIVAVLGAVVDSDADKGRQAWPPVEANCLIQTSPRNYQHFLLFDRPVPPAEAKPLMRALKRATKADCADDMSHVWRIPGTLNFPTASKLARGRSPEPFAVRVERPWNGVSRTNAERLRAILAPHFEEPRAMQAAAPTGDRDGSDIAGMVRWLAERGEFETYEAWLSIGMALKLELGDAGLDVWRVTHDGTVTEEVEATKWRSFADDATKNSVTLNSWMKRAHDAGWKGQIRKSASAMFAGATLPPNTPAPAAMPMLAGQQILSDLASPTLADFLRNTAEVKTPRSEFSTLPAALARHALYTSLNATIARVIAMTENGAKLFRHWTTAVIEPLAILQIVHADTFDAVKRRVAAFGCELPDRKIKHAATALSDRVSRAAMTEDSWIYDVRGNIEADNPDNVSVFLGVIGCEIRWNGWREKVEIRGGNDPDLKWSEWSYVDDVVVAKLRTRAMRTNTRFRPPKEFLWEALLDIAHKNTTDPVIDRLAELQAAWDGVGRLDTWLSRVCGVADDAYHRAVARNIGGGMVRRARHPGCKHDTMAVLFGPQGTGKSTVAKIVALNDAWFSDTIKLGDEAKELVLSMAGKLVVEISEMSARNSASANGIKAMVSREVDAGRTAYARAVTERLRRNIFIGTTNDSEPLSDPTGNRRFLPVRCDKEMDLAWLHANIEKIIGEAATAEAQGDDFAIPRDVWAVAAEHADAVRSESDMEIRLSHWLAATEHTRIAFITAAELSDLCSLEGLRGGNAHRGAVMKRLGFRKERPYIDGRQVVVWYRGPDALPKIIEREAARYMVGTKMDGRANVAVRTDVAPLVPTLTSVLPPLPAR